jgi:hypothetical protein
MFFVVLFLEIFMFRSLQEYVIQQLPAQYLTDGTFGKLTVVKVGCSNSEGLRIKMSFFPPTHAEPSLAFPQIYICQMFSGESPQLSCRPVA